MMKNLFTTVLLLAFCFSQAQFTSPNTGVVLSLNDIANMSPSTITVDGNQYTLLEDILIMENDALVLDENLTLKIEEDIEIEIEGGFTSDADEIIITAVDPDKPFGGFIFRNTSSVYFKNTTITYGGGLRVLTYDFEMYDCEVSYQSAGVSTGGAISFSNSSPIIMNSVFKFNERAALASGANTSAAATIEGNYFEANNQSNTNAPQINMGPSGAGNLTKVINNVVIGDRDLTRVGGISVSSLLGVENNVLISGNEVRDNRFGIATLGNSSGVISDNIIEDNDTEGDPMLGGSGINLFNTNMIQVHGNEIRRNLWGVTLQGTAQANFGSDNPEDENPGMNIFSENGNGGEIYAIYNNTPNDIMALYNCWIEGHEVTLEDVEGVIFHNPDDSTLGVVTYDPFIECGLMNTVDLEKNKFEIYPNPAKHSFNVNSTTAATLNVYDLNGRLIQTYQVNSGTNNFFTEMKKGVYILEFITEHSKSIERLIVQ